MTGRSIGIDVENLIAQRRGFQVERGWPNHRNSPCIDDHPSRYRISHFDPPDVTQFGVLNNGTEHPVGDSGHADRRSASADNLGHQIGVDETGKHRNRHLERRQVGHP